MKFDCGETREEEEARLKKWHPHFFIIPRTVDNHDCRWLEWGWRRRLRVWSDGDADWEYRGVPK